MMVCLTDKDANMSEEKELNTKAQMEEEDKISPPTELALTQTLLQSVSSPPPPPPSLSVSLSLCLSMSVSVSVSLFLCLSVSVGLSVRVCVCVSFKLGNDDKQQLNDEK